MGQHSRHIKQEEVIMANDLFRKHLKKSPTEKGLWVYDEGWSDQRIASVIAPDLSVKSIAKLRLKIAGPIASVPIGGVSRKDVDDLLAMNLEIKSQLAEVTAKYNKLVETLSINKVVDVRHLKVMFTTDNPPLPISPPRAVA